MWVSILSYKAEGESALFFDAGIGKSVLSCLQTGTDAVGVPDVRPLTGTKNILLALQFAHSRT
jgi:hypothetical protein